MTDSTIKTVSSLKSLLLQTKSTATEFPGHPSFVVKVNFMAREASQKIRKKATTTRYQHGKGVVDNFDEELFLQLYTDSVVKGWSGLTLDILQTLIPMEAISEADKTTELEYSKENALMLMRASGEFDSFITDTASDLENFQ